MADLAALVAAFSRDLRGAGIAVTPERSSRFANAILLAGPSTVEELFWLGRTTLVTGQDQYDAYARVFDRAFRGILGSPRALSQLADERAVPGASSSPEREPQSDDIQQDSSPQPSGTGADPGRRIEGENEDDASASALAAVSVSERLMERSCAELDEEELLLIRNLVSSLPIATPMRRGLRSRRAPHGSQFDVRATLRRSYRTAGDPIRLVTKRRRPRPRRIVLIADVSGSMAPYARVYLHLLRGAVVGVHAEAFVFATRLTRLTRALATAQPDAAYRKVAEAAPDWSSGTRIGRSLLEFIDEHGRRGVARGAVVVIVSDGWEIEDPALVGLAMERLGRLAHRIIWVNPRKAAVDFAPLAGGMARALPHVDTFLSGHSVQALGEVVAAIGTAGARRVPGRARDCLG